MVEEYAFVGLNSTVLPGVTIGRGAVVGDNSIIIKDVKPYAIDICKITLTTVKDRSQAKI